MSKNKTLKSIINANSNGKLYIESSDFFNQPKIQQVLKSLMESTVFKKIVENKDRK